MCFKFETFLKVALLVAGEMHTIVCFIGTRLIQKLACNKLLIVTRYLKWKI